MKRFLCARDGSFSLSDEGFLQDPEGEYGHLWNPDVVIFDDLQDTRCLVVLGEPGLGKSTEFERLIGAEKQRVVGTDDKVLDFRLREYDSGGFLCDEIFESHEIEEFMAGSHKLYLFLDDLDEGLLSISTLASLLGSRLAKLPAERLFLRIACRTAEWPKPLETSLENHWGEIKVRELVPLRRKDVAEFVAAQGIDTEQFFSQILEKEIVPFAIKPLTLRFLVNMFQKGTALPKTQTSLYAEACRVLCDDNNQDRIAAGKRSSIPVAQLLAVAERIAAVSIFSNRAAIWYAPDLGDVPDSDVTVSRLCGGYEKAHGDEFQVTETHIREAIKTGLFNSRGTGTNRMGWAHQTYAEFLAACYLQNHGLPTSQKLGLLVHPNDDEGRLIPQLYETAAWLARMDDQLFEEILSRDPEVLLRSDLSTTDPEARERLVETLLTLFDEEKLLDKWELQHRYKKLEHPRLAEQLRRFICDTSKGFLVRRVAIDIAEECNQKSLQHDLAEITLNGLELMGIRVEAAHALIELGDVEARARLKPLAYVAAKDDPDDQLKGCALKATWPDVLSTQEVFSLLTYPQKRFFLGAYLTFLYDFSGRLTPIDVIPALEWVKRLNISSDSSDSLSTIRNRIIELSKDHIDGVSNSQTDAN